MLVEHVWLGVRLRVGAEVPAQHEKHGEEESGWEVALATLGVPDQEAVEREVDERPGPAIQLDLDFNFNLILFLFSSFI